MLQLSQSFIDDIVRFGALDSDQRKRLELCLEKVEPCLNLEEAVERGIAKEFPRNEEASSLHRIFLSLHYAYAGATKSKEEFSQEIAEAAKLQYPEGTEKFSEVDLLNLVVRILSINSLAVGVKATLLSQESNCIFFSSRIITDIRPVFGADIRKPDVSAAFLMHSLHLRVRSGDEDKDIFITLSTKDLASLQGTIQRALDKTVGLSQLLPKISECVLEVG